MMPYIQETSSNIVQKTPYPVSFLQQERGTRGHPSTEYLSGSATSNQPMPAWEAVCRTANKDSAQQARDLLSAIQETLKWFPDFSDMIPQLRHSIAADGSVLFEWIFSDYRIGFNIEPNPQESSWYLVTNRKLGEISASGFISHINLRVLIQFLFSFIRLT